MRVVGTLFDRSQRFARELLIALHARFGRALFDTVIRTSVRLREAPAMGLPVHALDPSSRAAADFDALAAEIAADRAAAPDERHALRIGAALEASALTT